MQLSDEEILSGIRGNQLNETIYAIYRQFKQTVRAFILSNGGNHDDSEDIFQETVIVFIDLVQQNKYRGDAAIKTFLVSIARNLWMNEWKKKKSLDQRGKVFEINRGEADGDITQLLDQREIKQQFLELIESLGEPCRTILHLYYYENLPYREIVKRLHYENEQVVRNKKYKCMKDLTELAKNMPQLMALVDH
jgi:RNA polymerase sigma factor (sigma-70 family)